MWHGLESHEFAIGISHKDALNPNGQEHVKLGDDAPGDTRTWQEPPFWHLGPGPVSHGFKCWQYSPTYFDVQLKQKQKFKLEIELEIIFSIV